jgi:hypothetical protein
MVKSDTLHRNGNVSYATQKWSSQICYTEMVKSDTLHRNGKVRYVTQKWSSQIRYTSSIRYTYKTNTIEY